MLVVEHDLAVLDYLSGMLALYIYYYCENIYYLMHVLYMLYISPYILHICVSYACVEYVISYPILYVYIYMYVDYICCLYGTPSAYGVVTMPFSVREGINIFLAGFVPTENLRFRDEELNFKMSTNSGMCRVYVYVCLILAICMSSYISYISV